MLCYRYGFLQAEDLQSEERHRVVDRDAYLASAGGATGGSGRSHAAGYVFPSLYEVVLCPRVGRKYHTGNTKDEHELRGADAEVAGDSRLVTF